MEKCASGATCAIDDIFGEYLKIFRVVIGFVADHFDQAAPAMAESDHLIAFAERAEGDAPDCGVEAGDVAASGENTDDAFLGVDVCHVLALVGGPFAVKLN
jgi:hypothetical protein